MTADPLAYLHAAHDEAERLAREASGAHRRQPGNWRGRRGDEWEANVSAEGTRTARGAPSGLSATEAMSACGVP